MYVHRGDKDVCPCSLIVKSTLLTCEIWFLLAIEGIVECKLTTKTIVHLLLYTSGTNRGNPVPLPSQIIFLTPRSPLSNPMAPKSVLITGCSAGGIGSALAIVFQQQGIYVFATARTISKMTDLEKFPNVTLISLDVTSPSSIAVAVHAVQAKTGGTLDYLVNNSGGGLVMPVLDTDIDEARRIFEVNIFGLLAVTQAFAPFVIAAKGTVVNNSPIAGCCYPPYMSTSLTTTPMCSA